MAESNVERARRGWEAAMNGDLDVIAGMLDPDVKWHGGDPTAPGSCHNRGEAVAFIRAARDRQGFGELVEMVDAGDKIVAIARRPADGQLIANLSTWRNGKVVEMVHYPDPDDALAAIGR